ncbi:unnamed protein product [Acanthoscelides obtectus]|uniref:Major facilitator superfamily (MFS) profile domain-containing protein n=1 Tax=Acanthoscelides obtectus TaxID=200917 RepID=A0A9P0KL99_ACAOB|nr:unnamed protein product [Acanthoscelides obtectus]CAK1639610.1 Putative niacin/nicotinamide transporter NaiP [Acanthoscelides obtectus]
MLEINVKKEHGFNFYLYGSLLTVNLALFSSSTTLVWSSPVIPQLLSNDTNVNPLEEPITPVQQSLIGGLPYFGGILGPLLLERLCDILGRKKTSIILAVVTSIAFGILAFAKHLYAYYALRTILGGLLFYCIVVTSVYSSELTEDHNRGKFQCLLILFHVSGFLYGYALDYSVFTPKIEWMRDYQKQGWRTGPYSGLPPNDGLPPTCCKTKMTVFNEII